MACLYFASDLFCLACSVPVQHCKMSHLRNGVCPNGCCCCSCTMLSVPMAVAVAHAVRLLICLPHASGPVPTVLLVLCGYSKTHCAAHMWLVSRSNLGTAVSCWLCICSVQHMHLLTCRHWSLHKICRDHQREVRTRHSFAVLAQIKQQPTMKYVQT